MQENCITLPLLLTINVCALKMVEVPKFFTKNNEISGIV
jgi:hypothetical protein